MKITSTKSLIKRSVFILSLIIAISFTNSGRFYSQGWLWAKGHGGLNNDAGRAVCTDPSGNVIIAGGFAAPSMQIGTVTVNSLGSGDVYLAKFDPAGNMLWIQTIGGTGLESIGSVCTGTNGNIYICGSYDSPVLTIGTSTLGQASTTGNTDIYVAQYSTNGSCQWAFKYGGASSETARGIAYSSALNNVVVTGYFNTATFAFGAYNVSNSATSGASQDVFVARFNATFGTATGAFSTGGVNSNDYGHAVVVDGANIYVGGSFSPITGNTSTIGSAVTSLGSQDVFIAKYTNAQAFQWVRTGGSASTSADYFTSMDIDASSNIYFCGAYYGLPMTIGSTTLPNLGTNDAFIAKYNSAGTFQWANKVGDTGSDFANGVTVDGNNNIYLTGYFSGTVVTVGSYSLNNTVPGTTQDIFVVKYNPSGTAQWVSSAACIGYESAYGIAADAIGNVYVTGAYNVSGPMAFGTTTISSNGNNDSFLAKIGCLTATIGGISNVCSGASATLTAGGATNYTWSTGATTSSIVIIPSANTTYTVLGVTGACSGSSNNFSVAVLPASVNPGPNLNLLCNQSQQINATTIPASPTSVTWTPSTGLSSASTLSPTVTPPSASTQYTVKANLTNGCTATATLLVTQYAPVPDICMITVDSLSINNEIYWEKTLYPNVDSFVVYREVSTNIFKRVGAVSYNAFSMYTDTSRNIGPANGNPNLTSYKYRLVTRDVCGNYSTPGLYHQTIFIQDQQNGNFNWNSYAIESSPTPVSNYILSRQNILTGVTTTIGATTANLLSDPQYTTLATSGNVKWYVNAQGFNCNPTMKTTALVQKTRTKSNNSNDKQFPTIGIKENADFAQNISVYPNPTNGNVIIYSDPLNGLNYSLQVNNILGQTLLKKDIKAASEQSIDLSTLGKGVYFINFIHNSKTIATKKVVVE
ncbi:MAG: T9SS type A sorting domain-containing protein [Bacteroidetes bacterium]|nr:T9SS type A sorting domain-containing protein [Bacteroidota bacterium]